MIDTLYIWWNNICGWYVDNEQAITTFFMSGQFVSLIGALFMLVKNIKQIKSNTASTEKLDTTLNNTNEMASQIKSLEEKVAALTEYDDHLTQELNETRNQLNESNCRIVDKLNAIIEVQSIVYTTIRDDSVRQTVNTILNNARYSEKNFKEQLESKIDDIKKEFESKMIDMNDTVNKAITDVANSVNAAETASIRAKALKNARGEPTRY
jgi:esterase/lipase